MWNAHLLLHYWKRYARGGTFRVETGVLTIPVMRCSSSGPRFQSPLVMNPFNHKQTCWCQLITWCSMVVAVIRSIQYLPLAKHRILHFPAWFRVDSRAAVRLQPANWWHCALCLPLACLPVAPTSCHTWHNAWKTNETVVGIACFACWMMRFDWQLSVTAIKSDGNCGVAVSLT